MKVICDSFGSKTEIEVAHTAQIKSKFGDFKIVESDKGLMIYAESHPGDRMIIKPWAANCIEISANSDL